MKTAPPLVLVASLAASSLLACGIPSEHREMRIVPGFLVPVPAEHAEHMEREAFVRRAQADLGCAALAVEKRPGSHLVRATGCSKRAVYARVYRDAPDDERTALVDFQDLSRLEPGSADLQRDAQLSALVEIQVQASMDLQCPRGEIVPEVISTHGAALPVAEGCDKRATYLPPTPEASELRVMALTPARGVPTGFVPWTP